MPINIKVKNTILLGASVWKKMRNLILTDLTLDADALNKYFHKLKHFYEQMAN